ncbi:MAG: PDZ domain-containing protein [Acidobacteria bacterium]|nr:PDZ domain-containing protein [Acidobacteriota bacterium]
MEQRSQYYGIGASIQQRNRGVYIIEPFKDTPAGRRLMRYGDQIIAINGQNSRELELRQSPDNLRGELGTEARVTVRRAYVDIPAQCDHGTCGRRSAVGTGYLHASNPSAISRFHAGSIRQPATRFSLRLTS